MVNLENIQWEYIKVHFQYAVFGFDSVHKPFYYRLKSFLMYYQLTTCFGHYFKKCDLP